MRETTKTEKQVLNYLNGLRISGITNMFGARPYIIEMFEMDRTEAGRLLALWMQNFNEDGNYEQVKMEV